MTDPPALLPTLAPIPALPLVPVLQVSRTRARHPFQPTPILVDLASMSYLVVLSDLVLVLASVLTLAEDFLILAWTASTSASLLTSFSVAPCSVVW